MVTRQVIFLLQVSVRHEFSGSFLHTPNQRVKRGAARKTVQMEVQQDGVLSTEARKLKAKQFYPPADILKSPSNHRIEGDHRIIPTVF